MTGTKLAADNPTIGKQCMGCQEKFVAGDHIVMMPIGPGANVSERARAKAGRPYNAVAIVLHADCADPMLGA